MISVRFELLIIVGCLLASSVVSGQDIVGTECMVRRNSRKGVCSYITDCPHVQYEFTEGISYTSCGSQNGRKVVCCINPKTTSQEKETTTTTSTTTTAPSLQRIHEVKCKEYRSAIYQESIFSSLIEKDDTKLEKCLFKYVPLIIGGENATAGEFPHMALLGYTTANGKISWECGGSLISEKFVLTAGHCLDDFIYGNVTVVRLGALDYPTDQDNDSNKNINVLRRFAGPGYSNKLKYNDIGLLELERIVKFTPYIRPACLPSEDGEYNRSIASGWGVTSFSGNKPSILQKVVLEWFTFDECMATFNTGSEDLNKGVDTASQFCAGSKKEQKDACQGDSGGPLQIYHEHWKCMYTLIGITSFGQACATPDVPGIYTYIYYYLDWIESIVWNKTEESFDVRNLD